MSCKDTQKFRTSEASTKAAMRTQGAIDKFLNILDLGSFRKLNSRWSKDANERFSVQGMLFSEEDNGKKAVANKDAFKQIDNAKGIYYQISTPVKSGVEELFESNPELASIGTPQQYSEYLDTIFPDSQVKDIVYHGGYINKDAEFKIGNGEFGRGIYFTPSKESAQEYLSVMGDAPNLISAIVDLKNPVLFEDNKPEKGKSTEYIQSKFSENPNNDGSVYTDTKLRNNSIGVDERFNDEVKVNSSKQIHVLGSKQDVEGFKKFTSSNKQSAATDETIAKVKKVVEQMGVSLMTLSEYAKVSDIETKDVNGLADLTRKIIAYSEGLEDSVLTEEMVHVALAILQQTNPKLVTEMISKIDRFVVYKKTLEQYKNDPRYQTEDGKPNIRKIKMEAVGKMIAEVIVNDGQNTEEFPELLQPENLSLFRVLWNAVTDFFRATYRNSDMSLFRTASDQIMEGVGSADVITEDGVYLQKADDPVENIFNTYRDIHKATSPPVDNAEGIRVYKNDGEEYGSVTTKIKGNLNLDRSEFDTIIDNQKKDWGLEGHAHVEAFLASLIDEVTGLKRVTPLPFNPDTKLPISVQRYIEEYVTDLVNSYKPGSRFLIESRMVNKKDKIASTIDLTVFEPDTELGFRQDTYDWKFTTVNKQDTSPDINFLKQDEWKKQMGYYTKMAYNLGVKPAQVRRSRMIPFVLTYEPTVKGDWSTPIKIKSLEVGKFDNLKETKLYLMPVALDAESTGSQGVDKLLESLRQEYKKMFKVIVSPEEKYAKNIRLQQISEAIRRLQMTLNFDPLVNVMGTFLNQAKQVIDSFADIDYANTSEDQLREKLKSLIQLKRSAGKYIGIDKIYNDLFKTAEMTAEQKKTLEKLVARSASTERMLKKINTIQKEYVIQLGLKNNLSMEEIVEPQKAVDFLSKTFLEASKLASPIIKLGANLMMRSRKVAKIRANRIIDEFGEKLAALEKVASAKGKSAFDMIGKVDDGQLTFIKKLDKEYFNDISKAKKNKNKKFFLDNMDVEAYNELSKQAIERGTEELNRTIFSSDPEVDSQKRTYKIKQLRDSLDINSNTFNGYDGYAFANLFGKVMKEEGHLSEEYKEMQKTPAAFEMWQFFTQLNQRAREMGYLSGKGNSFFPLIEASFFQKVNQSGDVLAEAKDFFKDLYSVKVGEEHVFGKYDPETQTVKKEIPKLFTRTNKSVDQLSRDLNRVGVLWINAIEQYQESKNIEDVLLTLHSFERTKGQLAVDPTSGELIEVGGRYVEEDKSANADYMETIIDDYLYGIRENERSLGNVQIDTLTEKFSKDDESKNKRKTNIKKGLSNMNTLTQSLAVGLKALVAIPNYMGQNFLAFINAGSMYTSAEYFKNQAMVIGDTVGFPALTTMKKGLIDLFVPLNENIADEKQREIALKSGKYDQWLSTWNFNDVMMSTNAYPEKKLQITNALSFIDNTMVIDGKLVNIRQYVKRQDQKRYKTMSFEERRALEKTQDARIKELQDTKSLEKTAQIENGRFVIPGVSDEEIARYSTQIVEYGRKLSGQMNPDNKADYWRDTTFKSLMMFKGWIPKGISERALDLQKNLELDEYSYGRTRLFLKTVIGLGFKNINKISDILQGTDEGLRLLDEMLAAKKEAFFKKNGYQLDITEEEFYDLVRRELGNQFKELGMLIGLVGLLFAAAAAKPDDDADEFTKNRYKFWAKLTNKTVDELAFYYNPTSFESMTKGSLVPAVGILSKSVKFLSALEEESRGHITGNQELIDKSYPIKYGLDLIPVASQFQRDYLPYIYPEFAKEMGIRVSAEARQGR